ncbi:MAG: hypothetical protein ACD_33C00045G0036, partial [uncultured bacterium]
MKSKFMKKYTTEIFIKKAIEVHGNNCCYGKVNYINANTKITITCLVDDHGDFTQTPGNHLFGQSCPKCGYDKIGDIKRHNTEEFIRKAMLIHGDRYGYENSNYLGAHIKVILDCYIHGPFEQTPAAHLRSQGCVKCQYEFLSNYFVSNTQEFITKAIKIHGNKFDYSKSVYINAYTNIIIICPIHGEFEQKPDNHLQSKGCSKCSLEEFIINHPTRLTQEEFIIRAKQIHGDKFDYSKVVYINGWTKIIIVCPIHGDFLQTPNDHLQGSGCPICKSSKGELAILEILKKHGIKFTRQYQIPEIAHNLYYDFYLPDYNLLIEFHGIQHYEYVSFFHDDDDED